MERSADFYISKVFPSCFANVLLPFSNFFTNFYSFPFLSIIPHPRFFSHLYFQIPGGVAAPKGFRAFGMYAGLRAAGEKPDLALVVADNDATVAGQLSFRCSFSGKSDVKLSKIEWKLTSWECYKV